MTRKFLSCVLAFILSFSPYLWAESEVSFANPTVSALNDLSLCNSDIKGTLKNMSDICKVVLESPICKNIEKERRLNCVKVETSPLLDAWHLLSGCVQGTFSAIESFLSFIWSVMKWVSNPVKAAKDVGEVGSQVGEYMNIVRLYLHTEFEKAYDQVSFPFKTIKALRLMGGSIGQLILGQVTDLISQKYHELGCLNLESRSKVICEFIGEIFIPPAAAFTLLKYGPKAISTLPNVKKAFAKLEKKQGPSLVRNKKRLADAEKVLGKPLNKKQKEAIVKAHEVGKGKLGRDGSPARIGNYTLAQIRAKAKILKEENLSQNEIRQLMKGGIVGLSGSEAKTFPSILGNLFRKKQLQGSSNPSRIELNPDSSILAKLGQEVSVPRSSGGRSAARVTDITRGGDGIRVRVDFVDIDGERKYKWVKSTDLDVPSVARPPPSHKIIPANGRSVSIPRSGGGLSNGQIAKNLEGGKVQVVFRDTDGLLKEKVVPNHALFDPINIPGNHIKLGDKVSVPRAAGGRSNGQIKNIQGDEVRVDFVDKDGHPRYKWVKAQSLGQHLKGAPSGASLPHVAIRNGLAPSESVAVKGADSIKVGKFFKDSGGRVFTIAEVNVGGRSTHQLFYMSKSQSVFRLMPARNKGLAFPGYDKGLDENMLTAPPQLQAFLSKKLRGVKSLDVLDPKELEGVIPVNRTLDDYRAYKRSDDFVDERFVKRQRIVDEAKGRRTVSDGIGRELARPEDIRINNPQWQPNYSSPQSTYDTFSPLYGDVKAYIYKSNDGKLEYTLFRDGNNRVWMGDVGYSESSLTHHGLRKTSIDAGELTTPLMEYSKQIPKGYKNHQFNPHDPKYESTWDYIRRIPLIQRWYRENGLVMPE